MSTVQALVIIRSTYASKDVNSAALLHLHQSGWVQRPKKDRNTLILQEYSLNLVPEKKKNPLEGKFCWALATILRKVFRNYFETDHLIVDGKSQRPLVLKLKVFGPKSLPAVQLNLLSPFRLELSCCMCSAEQLDSQLQRCFHLWQFLAVYLRCVRFILSHV